MSAASLSAASYIRYCARLMCGRRCLIAVMLISLSGAGWCAVEQATPDIPRPFVAPAEPEPDQEIFAGLFYPIGGCSDGTYSVERQGFAVVVTHFIHLPAVTDFGTCFLSTSIGALPAGTYVLQWNEQLIPDVVFPGVHYLFTYFKTFHVGSVLPVGNPTAQPIPTLSWPGLSGLIVLVACLTLFAARSRFNRPGANRIRLPEVAGWLGSRRPAFRLPAR